MLASGTLREYIAVLRKQTTVLPDGSETVEWVPILQTHAHMKMGSGGIDVIAAQDNISQVFVFTIRFRKDVIIKIDDRLVWRDRGFKIHKLDFDILRTHITITCRTDNESTDSGTEFSGDSAVIDAMPPSSTPPTIIDNG